MEFRLQAEGYDDKRFRLKAELHASLLIASLPTSILSGVSVRSRRCGVSELSALRVTRAAINKLRSISKSVMIRRQTVFDHRREILIDLLEDFTYRLRMKDALAQPRAARQPVREVAGHLFELAGEGAFVQFVFQ